MAHDKGLWGRPTSARPLIGREASRQRLCVCGGGESLIPPLLWSSNIFWFCTSVRPQSARISQSWISFLRLKQHSWSAPGMLLKFNGSGWRISKTWVVCLAGNLIGPFLPPTGKQCSLWTLLWPGEFVLHCVWTACSLTHLPASSSDWVYVTLFSIVQHNKWSCKRPPVFNHPPQRDKD